MHRFEPSFSFPRCGALIMVSVWMVLVPPPAAAAEFVAPYVASTQEDVEAMLELADVGPGDYVIDLGSGDGRIVITAALRGAMSHGVELDRELVAQAESNVRAAEVGDTAAFLIGDIFEASLGHASVVTMYLMPEVNLRLRPKLLEALTPGSRVVSNSFDMGDWEPDRRIRARSSGGILMWIVPARVDGSWSISFGTDELCAEIEQSFQEIDLTLTRDDSPLHLENATLKADRVAFLAGDGNSRYAFSGRVHDGRMSGVVQVHDVDGARVLEWRGEPRCG